MVELGSTLEKTGQLLIKDNGNLRFRPIEISDASLVERKNGIVTKGWRHFFKLQFQFEGRKGIPGGMYTLSHERDIIYDPCNILEDSEKPEPVSTEGIFNRRGIKEVAASKCYKHEHQKAPSNMLDKVTWALIVIAVLFGIAIFKNWVV